MKRVHYLLCALALLLGTWGPGNAARVAHTVASTLSDTSTAEVIKAKGTGGLKLQDKDGTLGLAVEDGGNVGIGTTNPDDKLEVTGGDVQFNSGAGIGGAKGGNYQLDVKGAGATSATWSVRFRNSSDAFGLAVRNDTVLQIGTLATAPATCAIGDLYVDTSGAYCGCTATNTWSNFTATGSCS